MKQKDLSASMGSVHFVDDDLKASPSSSFNLCCSYVKEKLEHYCSVFQEASDIRFKLRPCDFIHSNFK